MKQVIDANESATQSVQKINNNFNELYDGDAAVSGGVSTIRTDMDIRDGGEYIECEYYISSVSSSTKIFDRTSYFAGDKMLVDGVEKNIASSYQFASLGYHIVKAKLSNQTTLVAWVFNNVTALIGVRLPSSVTTVEERAFNGAVNMRYIAFGSNISSVSMSNNYLGNDIIMVGDTPPTNVLVLSSNQLAIAHVKSSALAAYKSAANWSAYSSRITDEPIIANHNTLYDEVGRVIDVNPLIGKSFAFLGDSFTSGYGNSVPWAKFMCRKLNARYLGNYSIAGQGWTSGTRTQAQNLVNAGSNPDYILIFLGVNDRSSTLGTISYSRNAVADYDAEAEHTFTSGVQATLALLQSSLPNSIIKIGWTPNGSQYTGSGDVSSYINRLKALALLYGVEYIETRYCGLSTLASDGKYFEGNPSTPNPTSSYHPTQIGHKVIGEYMARTMLCHL